jgi:hypothetical protein
MQSNPACPHCSNRSVKNGKHNAKQRFLCSTCSKTFYTQYSYKAYHPQTNYYISSYIKESCGIRSIARLLKISTTTIFANDTSILNITFINEIDTQQTDARKANLQSLLNCNGEIKKRQVTISEKSITEFYCDKASFFICDCPKGVIEIKLTCKNEMLKNKIISSIKLSYW